MPIEYNIEFERMSQDEFHALDKRVMRHAFDIHNTMGRFVSTTLSRQDRFDFELNEEGFGVVSDGDDSFRQIFSGLLDDWGAFLDVHLYREALAHFCGGLQSVEVIAGGRDIGAEKMYVLDDETIWHLSSVRNQIPFYQTHLLRLFHHTRMKRMHWINLNHRNITIQTLKNDSVVK